MSEKRNGTIRTERLRSNLLNSPFAIDQYSFSDLMGYISALLRKINYYDLDNEVKGNWKELIERDPIVCMVLIINEPVEELEDLLNSFGNNKTVATEQEKIGRKLLQWFDRIEEWKEILKNAGDTKLYRKIENVQLDVLTSLRNQILSTGIRLHNAPGSRPNLSNDPDLNLDASLHKFLKVVFHIQEFTLEYLEENLYEHNRHMPHVSLYLTFTLLYQHVQQNINQLTQKHLDFYYKNVLEQTLSKGKETHAVVHFDLLPHIPYTLIAKGAKMTAGKLFGSTQDVLFETKKPIVVYPVQLEEMETLFFNYNKVIKIGTQHPTVSSVYKNTLLLKGKPITPKNQWWAFGATEESLWDATINPKDVAEFGFIIQSPVLLLTEGKRTIDLNIQFETPVDKNPLWSLLGEIKNSRGVSLETAFSGVFETGFKMSFSTKKGWQDIAHYGMDFNASENTISIHLVLDRTQPPVTADSKILSLDWPSIKVELNEYAPVYLYSFFKGVEISTISIDVAVENMKDLALYNNVSKIPSGKTADLFGPRPTRGNYFLIGKEELFSKRLNSVEVELQWQGLPAEDGGFESYYSQYSQPFNNSSFKIRPSILSGGHWIPSDETEIPQIDLFETHEIVDKGGYCETVLKTTSSFQLNELQQFGIEPNYNLSDPLQYNINSISGFFRFTLEEPAYGFGLDLYQNDFTDIATFNARNKKNLPYPNKPYVPKVSDVSVNYTASDVLIFDDEFSRTTIPGNNLGTFQHITPFGVQTVIENQIVKTNTLLKYFKAQGYLFLGLTGVKEETTISIYFQLHLPDSMNIQETGKLAWEYYNVDEWKPLRKGDIILDGTNGFIKSGIVELTLPPVTVETIAENDNKYWIRIAAYSSPELYPRIEGIYMNATQVVCTSQEPSVIGQSIPANSILKMEGKFPDIKSVSQPDHSFGGAKIETEEWFYTRISERLRHKSRAVSMWDYEHLVLQHFDDVFATKANNLNHEFKVIPGTVNVIVLGNNWSNSNRQYFDANQLFRIQKFLAEISSKFVHVNVMNPTEEYLLVNVSVQYKAEDKGGYYLNQLNSDISEFLSPMSKDDNGLGGVGGSLIPSSVISFIENLDYIDRVFDLSVEHIISNGNNNYSLGIYQGIAKITATKPWSLLIPVEKHHIVGSSPQDAAPLNTGIGQLQVGMDFILGNGKLVLGQTKDYPDWNTQEEEDGPLNSIFVFQQKPSQS